MAANTLEQFVSALKRMGGMHGSAWIGGVMQTDVVEVLGTAEQQRQEITLVGQQSTGFKPTRVRREGTLRVQKIDTRWELFVYSFFSQTLEQRRAARGTPAAAPRTFSVKVAIDDPDAYGYEAWQLDGCQIWRMQVGSSQTEEHIERDYPLTWERETPLNAFTVSAGSVVTQNYGT